MGVVRGKRLAKNVRKPADRHCRSAFFKDTYCKFIFYIFMKLLFSFAGLDDPCVLLNKTKEVKRLLKITREEAEYLRSHGRGNDIHISSATKNSRGKRYYVT